MEHRLVQNQSQKLILSPQIRQYLRLLQMPIMELAQAVDQELAENPLLEEKELSRDDETPSETAPETAPEDLPEPPPPSRELQLGESFENFRDWNDDEGEGYNREGSDSESDDLQKKKDYRESLLTRKEALSDYLMWQIRFLNLEPRERQICENIVGNIDEQGFLQASLEEMAAALHEAPETIAAALEKIQQLEPAGVGARTLQEALALQLKRLYPEEQLALRIINEQLPLLEKRDWPHLARIYAVSVDEARKAGDVIMRLEPRPGRSFYAEEPVAITPDAVISALEENDPPFRIDITNERIPDLRINAYYRHLLKDADTDAKTREFVKEKLQAALTFMKAMSQRRSTLYEITAQIVREQQEFLEKGFSHLKPLRLKDISGNLGIHESTVSRAIHGKYLQTPQGTIPYRSFFSSKLETVSGEAESQKSIMEKIKKLISEEVPEQPLSDQEIVEILKKDGLKIARRTVAKYRDLLKILPSHLRRKR